MTCDVVVVVGNVIVSVTVIAVVVAIVVAVVSTCFAHIQLVTP